MVTTILLVFPLLIYIFLGLSIPNYRIISDKKKRIIYQIFGLLLGGLLGAILGFFGPIMIIGMISGIALFFFGIIELPIGALTGFMIGRGYSER